MYHHTRGRKYIEKHVHLITIYLCKKKNGRVDMRTKTSREWETELSRKKTLYLCVS